MTDLKTNISTIGLISIVFLVASYTRDAVIIPPESIIPYNECLSFQIKELKDTAIFTLTTEIPYEQDKVIKISEENFVHNIQLVPGGKYDYTISVNSENSIEGSFDVTSDTEKFVGIHDVRVERDYWGPGSTPGIDTVYYDQIEISLENERIRVLEV